MNLKIKCDTPKEQVLVLRKFKKLVPECKWAAGEEQPNEWFPFSNAGYESCFLFLNIDNTITWDSLKCNGRWKFNQFTASDFLRDDWKLETKKLEVLAKIESLQKQLDELKDQIIV